MHTQHTGRTLRYQFDSLFALGEYINDTPRTWANNQSRTSSMHFNMNASYDDAVRYAREGWLEGAKLLETELQALPQATPYPTLRNDFYGHMPHVARYCAGAPDNMIRHAQVADKISGRVLTLYVPINALGGVSAKAMSNFGLAVAHYVNQLEMTGTRVELYAVQCSLVSGYRTTHTWRVKSAEQPLDLAVIAFTIGHPAMFRRLGFALRERCDAPQDIAYGKTVALTLDDLIYPAPGAFILNGMRNADTLAYSKATALAYVGEQIDRAMNDPEAA